MQPLAYYNEIDPYCARWLRNLIANSHIAPGHVDERDIRDVKPYELAPYTQCHFFAGIGGWSVALRLANISDNQKIWTGSCPCQPFSAAGFAGGFDDERHLWPAWFQLVAQCKPPIIFGEQVASKLGLQWFDLVQSDLENAHYSVGAIDLCAASVGAPHIRQRLWFVGHAEGCDGRLPARSIRQQDSEFAGAGKTRELADTNEGRFEEQWETGNGESSKQQRSVFVTSDNSASRNWSAVDWLPCTDGKARPVEPGTFPLAHGIPARVAKLCAFGNAIVPQVAAEFIKAALAQ